MLRKHLLLVALLASACAGCRSLVVVQEQKADPEVPLSAELVDNLAKKVDGDLWQLSPNWSASAEFQSQIDGVPSLKRLRWSHPGSLEVLQILQEQDESLPVQSRELSALAERDDLPGWNAAIVWAQLDPVGARKIAPVLSRLIKSPPTYSYDPNIKTREQRLKKNPNDPPALVHKTQVISPLMQAAAAEAWCLVLSLESDRSETPFAPALELLHNSNLSDTVQCDLLLGIARAVPPKEVPRLIEVLRAKTNHKKIERSPTEVRHTAVEACIVYAVNHRNSLPTAEHGEEESDAPQEDPWPDALWSSQWDEDPQVRKTFGEFVAIISHPNAFEILNAYLQDKEINVRLGALVNLGTLGTPAAREVLHKQTQKKEELIRTAAIQGLAAWGPAEIAPFAKNRAYSARREVAQQLGKFQNPEAAEILRQLVGDSNLEVQLTAMEAIEPWPNELAVPLLLQALRDGSFKTRQLGLVQLEQRRGETVQFPLQSGREDRVSVAASLAEAWHLPGEASTRRRPLPETPAPQADAGRLMDIKEHLATFASSAPNLSETSSDVEWLQQLTSVDVPFVERLLPTVSLAQAEVLFREVLAKQSPVYGAVWRLESPDVAVRRQGGESLSKIAANASLPPLAVRRMREPLVREQDSIVWRYVMSAILKDDSPECADVAQLAVNHNWPDIRVLGCEYIAYHGRHVHAVWLLPLFADPNSSVQTAAIRAAAKCHNPIVLDGQSGSDSSKGLRPLLISPLQQLRLAVAASMSCFGDSQGMQELSRLSLDEGWMVRKQAVVAMGESGQSRFVEHLVRVAWTESNHNVKHAVIGSLTQLVAPADRPQGIDPSHLDRSVELWVAWWDDQKRAQAARNLAESQTDPVPSFGRGANSVDGSGNQ